MRKLLLSVMVLVASATAAKAQFFVGGGLGFWYDKPTTSFNISPEVGYSFNDHWAVGLPIGFSLYKTTDNAGLSGEIKTTRTSFYLEPYARFKYFSAEKVSLFLDGVVGVSVNNSSSGNYKSDPITGFQIIIRPGIAVNLTDHFSLVGTFGALGYRKDYRNNAASGFGLSLHNSLGFGFYYSF